MPRFHRATLPAHARVHGLIQKGGFLDCYACETELPIQEAAALALDVPGWARMLLRLRHAVVAPLGLKTTRQDGKTVMPTGFPVTYQGRDEIQYGFDDTHLNFRVTALAHKGVFYFSTWVHVNNLFGRIYLPTIMPFHIMLMRGGMGRVARALPPSPVWKSGP